MKSKSTYHYQFGAIVKITLRDGNVSNEEKAFLSHLAHVMDISQDEYNYILQHYISYDIETVYTYNQRLESMYTLTKLIVEDDVISGEYQTIWLERIAQSIGFTPGNVKYIVAKSLSLIEQKVDSNTYKDEIKNINK